MPARPTRSFQSSARAPRRRPRAGEKGPNRGLRGAPNKKSFSCERLSGRRSLALPSMCSRGAAKEVLAMTCLSPEKSATISPTAPAATPPRFDQRSGYNPNAMETFQSQLTRRLSEALAAAGFPPGGEVSPATDPRFGDYQSNAALVLGKQRGEHPREIAEKIVGNLDVGDVCEPPVIAGPGFINFTLRPGAVAEKTANVLGDEKLGIAEIESPRRIVVDFGSPNVAKPMHVGHIRSTFLGDTLARIAQFLGHDVIREIGRAHV